MLAFVESARQSDWDGIVACHQGYLVSTTWNYHKSSMGSHKLEPDRFNKNRALSVHATVSSVGPTWAFPLYTTYSHLADALIQSHLQ